MICTYVVALHNKYIIKVGLVLGFQYSLLRSRLIVGCLQYTNFSLDESSALYFPYFVIFTFVLISSQVILLISFLYSCFIFFSFYAPLRK